MCILLGGELPLGALRAYGWAIYKGDLKGGAFFVGLPDLSKALRDRAMDWQQKKTWSCGPLCKNLQHVRNETSLKKQCQVEVFENRNYEHSQKYSKHKITQHRTLSIWGLTIWGWCALKKRLRCPCETFSNQSTSSLSTSTLP